MANPQVDFFTADDLNDPSKINWLKYPEDIGQSKDLQHYVLFYVNVRGKSKFSTSNRSKVPVNITGQNRLSGNTTINAATIGASLAVGTSFAGLFGKTFYEGAGAAITGALIGGGAVFGVTSFADVVKPDQSYRISDVIALQVDERPSVRYKADYKEKEVGLLGLLAGGTSAVDSAVTDILSESGLRALTALAKAPGAFFSGATPGDLIGLGSKTKTNPFREVFFEAMDFRTFTFKYRFFPRNETESISVQKIIDAFKFHMHPEFSSGQAFYVYPSEFDIVYCFKGARNDTFHKISSCALTNMTVDYGSETFSTFEDGSPTEYNLSLTFQELEVLTKERIKEGY